MKPGRPLMRFADNRNDEWTAACELEAAKWLRAGFLPDQLHPATGAPLEGALEEPDPESDPSVAETLLRDEVLDRARRQSLTARLVVALAVVVLPAVVGVAIWILG